MIRRAWQAPRRAALVATGAAAHNPSGAWRWRGHGAHGLRSSTVADNLRSGGVPGHRRLSSLRNSGTRAVSVSRSRGAAPPSSQLRKVPVSCYPQNSSSICATALAASRPSPGCGTAARREQGKFCFQ